jgi:actin related protein 2/3 complex subunit 5
MAHINWRTINVDLLDPESPSNFPTASLTPSVPPVSIAEAQGLAAQVKQLLRGGDAEGALRGALENPPYGGDAGAKVRSTPSSVIAERPRYSGETTV